MDRISAILRSADRGLGAGDLQRDIGGAGEGAESYDSEGVDTVLRMTYNDSVPGKSGNTLILRSVTRDDP